MLKHLRMMSLASSTGLAALAGFGFATAAHAEATIHAFAGGTDGLEPGAGLTPDGAGNLYGTTAGGGGTGCQGSGWGTVFEVAPDGTETVLYSFTGGSDGYDPEGQLIFDSAGNLYGATAAGGSADAGTVFKLAPDGTETVLYAFQNGTDGAVPQGNLAIDSGNNLYGTTDYGGNTPGCGGRGCGTVFKVTPGGQENVLYTFQGLSDGEIPTGGVIADNNGNLYGTALGGGNACDCGVVFKIAAGGTESVLYTFRGGRDGMLPVGPLVANNAGDLYGVTEYGGGSGDGNGTVFRIAPNGTEKVLYAFRSGDDGAVPYAGLVMDAKGNLYGTTYFGGGTRCGKTGHIGCGTVFKVKPDGAETVLFSFYQRRGIYPGAPLTLQGNRLYGTAEEGGQWNDGVVFSVKK